MYGKKIKNTVSLPERDFPVTLMVDLSNVTNLIEKPMQKAMREYLVAVFEELEVELVGSTLSIVGTHGDLYEIEISMDAHEALTQAFVDEFRADLMAPEELLETITTLRSCADRLQQKLEEHT